MSREFKLLEPRAQRRMRAPPFREWLQPDGSVWLQFYRIDQVYVLRFPRLADFEIHAGADEVSCRPAPNVSDETLKHLFHNQVMPLALSQRGTLVFHASAVDLEGGAVAFVADSGKGKSTLAASFASNGVGFLCDDGLILERTRGGYDVVPARASIRLWNDSEEALAGAAPQRAPALDYTCKARLLAGESMAYCAQRRPLRRAFFLGDGSAPAPTLHGLSASAALEEWVKHAFLLDPQERPLLASHFEKLIELASTVAAYRLDYPRRYEALAAVRRAIVAHVEESRVEAVG